MWTLDGTNSASGNQIATSGWEYWRYSEAELIAESAGHFDVDDNQRQVDGVCHAH